MNVLQEACDAFQYAFGHTPYWIASAPGRVNLMGEFTDYNDGFVLPMAIEQRTAIAAAPNASNRIVIRSELTPEALIVGLVEPVTRDAKGSWSNYPKGIVAEFLAAGHKVPGFDAVIAST